MGVGARRIDDRFAYGRLVETPALVAELAEILTARLRAAAEPAAEGYRLVDELRRLGYDLWSFDESDNFQAWCGDWHAPKQSCELTVGFSYRHGEAPLASATFGERQVANPRAHR